MARQEILTQWYHYSLYDVASCLQKSIRRGDWKLAGFMCAELFPKYSDYCWRRLLTISVEDCYGCITKEIMAQCDAFYFLNKGKKPFEYKGRLFLTKAAMLLCICPKSRDADILNNFVHDRLIGIDEDKLKAAIEEAHSEAIGMPDYVYDCHTIVGKMRGKTRSQFFIEEEQALKPRQDSLFDDLNGMFASFNSKKSCQQ